MADNAGIKVTKLKSQMYTPKSTALERHLKIERNSIHRFEVLLHSFLDFSETCRHHENVVPHRQKENEKILLETVSTGWAQQQSCQKRDGKPEKMSRRKDAQITRGQEREVACETERHLTIKAFLRAVRRLSRSNVNTQSQKPSRRVWILALQSVVQNKISTQSTARWVWRQGRGKQNECVFVYISKSVSSCLWREDGGKNSLAPVPSQDRKTAAEKEEGREGKIETEGEGEGLVWARSKSFPSSSKPTHSHRCSDCPHFHPLSSRGVQPITPIPHWRSSFPPCSADLNKGKGKCLRKQKPLERLSFVALYIFKLLVA